VLRNGMDPLNFIRYLATLGRIVVILTTPTNCRQHAEMDPEACYLGYEMALPHPGRQGSHRAGV
jgi:two-component system chemotaxis sensor kinase CheA